MAPNSHPRRRVCNHTETTFIRHQQCLSKDKYSWYAVRASSGVYSEAPSVSPASSSAARGRRSRRSRVPSSQVPHKPNSIRTRFSIPTSQLPPTSSVALCSSEPTAIQISPSMYAELTPAYLYPNPHCLTCRLPNPVHHCQPLPRFLNPLHQNNINPFLIQRNKPIK